MPRNQIFQKDYEHLHGLSRHIHLLGGISQLLDWDQETYMPEGAAAIRAEQLKALAGVIHKEKVGREFRNALAKLIDIKTGKILGSSLSDAQQAALRQWRRDYLKEACLPSQFVEDFAKLTSQSIVAWRHAKQENAFHHFAPFLDKIVVMCRQKTDYIGYSEHPYDALLDFYEQETSTAEVQHLFSSLKKSLLALLKKINAKKPNDDSFVHGRFDPKKQLAFGKVLLDAMGYDWNHGRLDLSTHPFSSSSHPTDSRITTRIHPTSLMSNIFAIMHECGHALYDMGLPIEHFGSPLGESISLGMHESQSRWWETRIGLSKAFWSHFLPLLKKEFKGQLDHVSLEAFYKGINQVKPSLIRIEADEVTYSLHIILRFELEKALIEGSLKVREIPEAWNAKMQELLAITPKTNAEGCLQDIHWSMGAFGYFPTYSLGNLYAAHLFAAFEKSFPNWQERVAKGELAFIKAWLAESVYQHGHRYSSKELLKLVTGKAFTEKAYIDYLTTKYQEIFA